MAKKSLNATKNEAIKFKVTDSIFALMRQWLMTLQEVYTEYHKEVTGSDQDSEPRRRAIGNMLLMIDFIDSPEQSLLPNLKDEEARTALKGMLASARALREHMRGGVVLDENEKGAVSPDLQDLAKEVDEQLTKVK